MAGIKIDGKIIAQSVKKIVKQAVEELEKDGITPCLATILVGDNQASSTYVKNKHAACKEVGIETRDHRLDTSTTQKELFSIIDKLNTDASVHGILVQIPLPDHLNEFTTISKILPQKDVDGLTPYNAGMLATKNSPLVACTPLGVMAMLDYHEINVQGKNVVIINRGNLIGKPLYQLLIQNDATVTMCHSKTKDIETFCRNADIVITAVGDRTKFTLTSDIIKEGAIVIDVAISRVNGKLVGDSDYDNIIQKASFATPVPGGVGPMTVAMLLKNTITAASLVSYLER